MSEVSPVVVSQSAVGAPHALGPPGGSVPANWQDARRSLPSGRSAQEVSLAGMIELPEARRVLKPRTTTDVLAAPAGFRAALAGWFGRHGKDYPWRRTREPYAILVSEVMLQQTQIATVLGKGYFTRFLAAFPDMPALAAADDTALLKAWEGLGYYRRARMLRETARAVIADHGGQFPHDLADLLKLPGVGPYTAGALRAFAFNAPAVLVDGNVTRVVARLLDFAAPVDDTPGRRQIWQWAAQLADPRRSRVYHAALMELGQTVCRPGVADCVACPVARFCRCGDPQRLPVKTRRIAMTRIDEHALWLRDPQGRLLLHHESGLRRTGLWKLPTRQPAELPGLPVLHQHCYSITRYRVTLHVLDGANLNRSMRCPRDGEAWLDPAALAALPVAAPFRRVIQQLLGDLSFGV